MRTRQLFTSLSFLLIAFCAIGCAKEAKKDGGQFILDWKEQMVAYEQVSNSILEAPMPVVDDSLSEDEKMKQAIARVREDAAKYDPVIEAIGELDAPADKPDLVELKSLSEKMLQMIRDDLLDFAAQADSGDTPMFNDEFGQKLYDTVQEIVAIAVEYDVDTEFLLDQVHGFEHEEHDHEH